MKRNIVKWMAAALAFMLVATAFMPVWGAHAEEFDVSAPAAVLMDAESGTVLFEKNSHEQRPAASITKVMTLCLVFDAIGEGRFALEDMLSASAHAASMGGSDIWLKEGEMMSVDDLLKATVIMSANDAAVVLAEAVSGSETTFVAAMNDKAKELGMNDTVFMNCNGLDEDGHVTSAYDVALMSRELASHPEIFNYTLTWMDSVRGGETQLVNTNKLIKTYNGITGLKTGTTGKAGSCISATAKRGDLSLIAVVLGAADTGSRFRDAASLLDYGFANWTVTVPENPQLNEVAIAGGMQKTLKTAMRQPPQILMKITEKSEIQTQVVIEEDLRAPVSKGDVIGYVAYMSGDKELARSDVRADEDVEAIGVRSTFLYLLCEFFRM
jgi:D-alanyl-D-alanine carboxypeptidase (penicillin-binding protein 5/6)